MTALICDACGEPCERLYDTDDDVPCCGACLDRVLAEHDDECLTEAQRLGLEP